MTLITQSSFNGRPYTRTEMLATATLLMHAGLDTVANILSFAALHLARNPADRDYIRSHPDKMEKISQELLRRFPVPNMARTVATDHVHKGVQLKKGDRIVLAPSFFNLDEELFAKPDEVDFERSDIRHISFGSGPHTCAGAMLARKEIVIFLEEWLARIPDFRLDQEPKMAARQSNGVAELWLSWDT